MWGLVAMVASDALGGTPRAGQGFYVAGAPMPLFGMIMGHRISEDLSLELGGGADLLTYYSHASIYLKQFVSDRTYLNYGAGYSTGLENGRSGFGPKLAIGTEWTWPRFIMGCDWLGVDVPIWKTRNFEPWHAAYPYVLRFYIGAAWK